MRYIKLEIQRHTSITAALFIIGPICTVCGKRTDVKLEKFKFLRQIRAEMIKTLKILFPVFARAHSRKKLPHRLLKTFEGPVGKIKVDARSGARTLDR